MTSDAVRRSATQLEERSHDLAGTSRRRLLLPGVLGSGAYLAEMALDLRLSPTGYDDLILWGGLVSRRPGRQRAIGLVGHFSLGIVLGAVYERVAPLFPKWPGWLRGLVLAEVEHVLTFPAVAIGDRVHPSVRTGKLPRLTTGTYFWVEALRHAAYGVALGSVIPPESPE